MDNGRDSLDFITIYCLRLLWDEIYANWEQIAVDAGLTVTEEQTLLAIGFARGSTVTDVAQILQRDKGTISKSVYCLECQGLVTRETGEDRRYSCFNLTEKGEKVRQEVAQKHLSGRGLAFAEGFLKLPEEERHAFTRTAFKLTRHVYGDDYIRFIQQTMNLPKDTSDLISQLLEETEK